MFNKAVHIKSTSNVRSSDAKKLKNEVATSFGISPEQVASLFGPHPVSKAQLEVGGLEAATLYSANTTPLFVRVRDPVLKAAAASDVLVPSLYTVFAQPALLPLVLTHSSVVPRLRGGADLMLPGVFGVFFGPSDARFFAARAPVQIAVKDAADGRLRPVAVAVALLDSDELARRMRGGGGDSKGRACVVVNVVGDQLFALGDGVTPAACGFSVPQGALSVEDLDLDDDDDEEIVVQDADASQEAELEGFVIVDKSPKLSSSSSSDFDILDPMDSVSIAGDPTETESIVKVGGAASPSSDFSPSQVDTFLEQALIQSLKFSLPAVDSKMYPLSATTLYSVHVLPLLPPAVDVKQSSFKKLQKFLKAMEKKGYLKVKERQQGGEMVVTVVYKNHPNVIALDMDEKAWKKQQKQLSGKTTTGIDASQSIQQEQQGQEEQEQQQQQQQKIEIIDIYKSSGPFIKLWEQIGISKETTFTRQSLKTATEKYISQNNLVHKENPRLVQIDAFLADAILAKDEYASVDYLPRDAIYTRIVDKMAIWQEFRVAGQEPVLRKGACKPIQLIVEKRAGRKLVTRVLNLESYFIKPEQFAQDLKIPCACSTSVSVLGGGGASGKPVAYEVMVQGMKVQEVCKWLKDHYGFPFSSGGGGGDGKSIKLGVKGGGQCKWVEVLDKS